MGRLDQKTAVITGGTRGIGFAIARAFAAEGAAVVIASRSAESVERTVEKIRSAGHRASGMAIDVGDLGQVKALAQHAVDTFGGFDIWINNAGVGGPYGPTVELTAEAFTRVIQTNILGTYYGSRTAMRYFLPRRTGKLINLVGHGAKEIVPFQSAYASSKSWVRSFTLALAKETQGSGLSVMTFQPGMVRTELLTGGQVIAGHEDKLSRFPRVIELLAKTPEKAAEKVVWAASAATDGKTGLEVTAGSNWQMLLAALRSALGNKGEPVEVHICSVPPAED